MEKFLGVPDAFVLGVDLRFESRQCALELVGVGLQTGDVDPEVSTFGLTLL